MAFGQISSAVERLEVAFSRFSLVAYVRRSQLESYVFVVLALVAAFVPENLR